MRCEEESIILKPFFKNLLKVKLPPSQQPGIGQVEENRKYSLLMLSSRCLAMVSGQADISWRLELGFCPCVLRYQHNSACKKHDSNKKSCVPSLTGTAASLTAPSLPMPSKVSTGLQRSTCCPRS